MEMLTVQQAAWVRYMLKDPEMDGEKAFLRAYGESSTGLAVRQGIASMVGNPVIAGVLEAEQRARAEASTVTRSKLITEMAKIAFAEIERGKLSASDKITALKELGRFIGIDRNGDEDERGRGVTYVFNMPPPQVENSGVLELLPNQEEDTNIDDDKPETPPKPDWDD